MVVLVTIASVVVCGWIAVWLLSDVGAAWLGAVAGLPIAMLPASIGTVILRWHPRRAASSDRYPARVVDSPPSATPVGACAIDGVRAVAAEVLVEYQFGRSSTCARHPC